MIRTRTLLAGVFVILLFLLPSPSQAARAQEVPCDNSQAKSVIPTDERGQPLMPKEFQDNAEIMEKLKTTRLTKKGIRRCLESDKPLTNHVIDFDWYVAAWREIKNQKRALRIQNSVLWSFKEKGLVNLATFTKKTKEADGKVTDVAAGKIVWHNVTLGPLFSAREIKFPQGTSINSSRFPDLADFSNTTFGDGTHFSIATFGNRTNFSGVIFGDNTIIDEATFGDRTNFSGVIFGDNTIFSGATFGNNTRFFGATFGNNTRFFGATFGDNTDFSGATFGDNTGFSGATFGDNTGFSEVTFSGDASLRLATFRGKLRLVGTNWEGRADLRNTEIQNLCWNSEYRPSSVKGIFDAREAKFKKAVIKDVHFSDLVDFSDVEFGEFGKISSDKDKTKTDDCRLVRVFSPAKLLEQKTEEFIFQNLIFEKEADFLRATFRHDTIFVRNRFRSVWDLTGVKLPKKEELEDTRNPHLCLSFNSINKLFMEREHLGYESSWTEYFFPDLFPLATMKKSRIRSVIGDGEYSCANFLDASVGENKSSKENEELWEIYKTIASTFRGTNDRLAENEAWYLSTVAYEESQYSDMEGWRPWIVVEYWALLIFADFPSRYGIDLYRVVLVSICLVLFFAIFYAYYFRRQIRINKRKQYVKLKPRPDQKRAFRFRPFERFFQSWERQKRPLHPLKDALFLSGRAFFKLGLGTAYPRTRMLVWIVHVEWILGMYMLIHFLLAVKNTLPIAVPFLAVAG